MDVSFQKVYQIALLKDPQRLCRARVLSTFEESSPACISDMLRHVSSGQYLEAIRMAEKFILHVEVLFATIDDLEWHFAQLTMKGNVTRPPMTTTHNDTFLTIAPRHVTCSGSAHALPEDGRFVHPSKVGRIQFR